MCTVLTSLVDLVCALCSSLTLSVNIISILSCTPPPLVSDNNVSSDWQAVSS